MGGGGGGVEWILKSESAQKVDPGEENSPAGIRTCNLSIVNPVGWNEFCLLS